MANLQKNGDCIPRARGALKQRRFSRCDCERSARGMGPLAILLKSLQLALLAVVLSMDIYLLTKAFPVVYRSLSDHRSQATNGQLMKIKFDTLAAPMTVRIVLVPQTEQRYDTLGDWIWTGTGLDIRLSREFCQRDPRYGVLLLVHELVEAMLCRSTGISTRQVDAFDMSFGGHGEPGDDPSAPYHFQHRAAEAAERALAAELGVKWSRYIEG
jgi:hypothetical protein